MYNEILAIVIIYDNEVIAVKEKNIKKDKWSLPLGVFQHGEVPLQCAIRSAYERLGIVLTQKDLVFNGGDNGIMVFNLTNSQNIIIMDEKINEARYCKVSHFKEQCSDNNRKLLEMTKEISINKRIK